LCFSIWDDIGGYGHDIYSEPLEPLVWLHVACTYDGYNQRIYINGIAQDSLKWSGTFTITDFLSCGIDNVVSNGQNLKGSIDEMRIWNTARNVFEIRKYMNTGLTGSEPGLIGYWTFDDVWSNIVSDRTSYNNDGILMGSVEKVISLTPVNKWLTVEINSGLCDNQSSVNVNLYFNAGEVSIGKYSAIITILSNDPLNPVVEIPVLMYVDSTTSINNISIEQIKIYPNPVSDLLTVEFNQPGKYLLNITSLNGQRIYTREMEGKTEQIDMTKFSKGIYFITVRSEKYIKTGKLLKF
jgi:hypothetical protein